MLFFSPLPIRFVAATRIARPAPARRLDNAPAPRSILERCIDVWTAPYASGVVASI